ncbi:transporter [Sulfolobus sp. E5-1-F]|uniref:transporter n=1 Tax=Saccharolobus sp. E5-1-F TaxID=2663019 RepID=UPI001295B1FF|nr:transporter [Sulfolobus sp. E5-1-F]QGA54868.1 transporter [Sulfolobus sp. E5-1-F]
MLGIKIPLSKTTILPVLSFTLSSYYLINFIFYLQYTDYTGLVEFLLIGVPFIGRAITPITYPFLMSRLDIESLIYLSLGNMAILDVLEFFVATNLSALILLRVVTGILFGLATSAAVELATQSRSKIIIGMTMGGWALGWILAALVSFVVGKLILIVSSFALIFFLLVKRSSIDKKMFSNTGNINIAFSWKALIIFLLGFEPAYILQLVPSLLGENNAIEETIIAYSISFIAYIIMPIFRNIRISSLLSSLLIGILGFMSFIALKVWLFIPFTVLGLGLNSLLPIIIRSIKVEVRKIGPSMNLASLSGFLIPSLVSIGDIEINSAILTLISSISLGVIVYKNLKIAT